MNGCSLSSTCSDLDALILHFIQPACVALGCRSPGKRAVFYNGEDIACLDLFENGASGFLLDFREFILH